jgi:pimeloyl-ACP methyl ester carboxylesterase
MADDFRTPSFVEAGSARVCYRTAGSGPALVLLHGFPLSGLTWRALVPTLSQRFTCYAFDLIGLGDSRSTSAADYAPPGQAAVLQRVLRSLGVESYAALGNDTGGWIARELALLERDRVTRLLLTNTEIPNDRPPWIPLYQLQARIPGSSFGFRRVLGSRVLRRSPLAFGGCFHDLDVIDGEFCELFVRPLVDEPARLAESLRFMVRMDFRWLDRLSEGHGQLSMPASFLWGADDPTFPEPRARAMLPQFPNVESFTTVPNAKLFFYEEQPELVAAWVVEKLSGTQG